MIWHTKTAEETELAGSEFASRLKAGDVVALSGDLGAGKTTFTRGIACYFGSEECHSPTFQLVNEYDGSIPLYHFDAYRIDETAWEDAGFDEYLFGDGICIIEWPERVEGLLPPSTIRVTLTLEGEGRRIEVLE